MSSPLISTPLWVAEARRLRDGLPGPARRALSRFEGRHQGPPAPPVRRSPRPGRSSAELLRAGRGMAIGFRILSSALMQAIGAAATAIPGLRGFGYQVAGLQFVRRHLIRRWPVPQGVFAMLAGANGAIYRTMWGPSEFFASGTLKDLDLMPGLSRVSVPVLLVSGRHDLATPAQMQPALERLPRAEWAVLEESAHLGFIEEPERYAAAVAGFLARHDG